MRKKQKLLFGNKKCEECGSNYDVVLSTCPTCKHEDKDFESYGVPKNILWLPIYKQLLIFALGLIALNVVSLIAEIIFVNFYDPESPDFLILINTIRYSIITLSIGGVLIGNYRSFKDSFNKWWPYLLGLAGMFVITAFEMTYGTIVNLFHETTTNINQEAANSVITAYPALSILVLGFLGPIVEEFTYRVGLFSFFRRINRWLPYIVTPIIFAFIHFGFGSEGEELINELLNLPSYIFAGLVFSFLYDFFGLSAALTAHISNNLLSILFSLLLTKV